MSRDFLCVDIMVAEAWELAELAAKMSAMFGLPDFRLPVEVLAELDELRKMSEESEPCERFERLGAEVDGWLAHLPDL